MWQDIRFGLRTLRKNPGFAAVAILALALGIGADATIFSLVNGILFKSLPFPDSERVMYLGAQSPRDPGDTSGISQPEYDDLRAQLKSFAGLAAVNRDRVNLSDEVNSPESYSGARITANGFRVLSIPPILGRAFTNDDAKPGAARVAILTYSLWQKRYGKDPSAIGRKIRVNTVPTTIIGVSAAGLAIPPEAELWIPYIPDPNAKRQNRGLILFGKLAPGVSRKAAQAEVSLAGQRFAGQYPETNRDIRYVIQDFNELNVGSQIRTVFLILMGAVGFVLLIACANVANLLLSRAAGRAREISIRAALGAGRWRVVRQLLAESLLLSIAGGLLGLAIASWGIRAFDDAVIPTGKPQWINFAMDYRAFGYLAAITVGTAILFGLAPALRLSRVDINGTIKAGGRAGSAIRGKYLSGVLVSIEMALAVVLLTGAVLMIRSFLVAYGRPAGVDTSNIATMRLDLPAARYDTPAKQLELQRQLVERLRSVPGVETAAVASSPFGNGTYTFPYETEERPVEEARRKSADFLLAGDGYFETLRLAALRGRVLTAADHVAGPAVAVVNETMARILWPNQDPVGRRFRFFDRKGPSEWTTVTGTVPDYLQSGRQSKPEPAAIIPYRQYPYPSMVALARTRSNAARLENTLRREAQALDPDLPARDTLTLDEILADSRWPLRVFGSMFTIFAGIALLLATVGLYAVVAYSVSQRTQEIGVRVALGASRGDIRRMVLIGGMRPAALGLAVGLAAAFGVARIMNAMLVGVSTKDPLTFGIVAGILLAAAIVGCMLPARSALRVDPATALRNE